MKTEEGRRSNNFPVEICCKEPFLFGVVVRVRMFKVDGDSHAIIGSQHSTSSQPFMKGYLKMIFHRCRTSFSPNVSTCSLSFFLLPFSSPPFFQRTTQRKRKREGSSRRALCNSYSTSRKFATIVDSFLLAGAINQRPFLFSYCCCIAFVLQ